MAIAQPTNRSLIIPNKYNFSPQRYKDDMRSLEMWARQPIQQLVAGSGVTLSPASGLATDSKGNGPNPITISASGGGGGGCLVPCKAVGGYSGEVADPPSGAATVDSYAVVTGDRILLTIQVNGANNGIWVANTAGAWTRPSDFTNGTTIRDGTLIPVAWNPGSNLFGTIWITTGDDIVGTTNPAVFNPIAGSGLQPNLPFLGQGNTQQSYNLSGISFGRHAVRKTAAYTIQGFESVVVSNSAVTLPNNGAAYSTFIIKDSGAGTASIVPNTGQTIDGSAASIALAAWAFREVQFYDGTITHWITI